MKRVLLLIKGLARGGAEQLLLSATKHADRERFAYEVAYLPHDKDALVADLREAGLPVSCLDCGRGAGWVTRLRSLVRDHEVDLLHAHSPYAAIGARLALPRRRVRLVYTEHNLWESYHPATYWGNLLTYGRNDHVFAVSDRVRASLRYPVALRFLRMPPVEKLYHGYDPAAMRGRPSSDVRAELGMPVGAPVVGTVANLRRHKGHQHLLRAADLVRRVMPDVRFVLVGGGPLEDELRRQAHELGLDGTVVFAGRRDDAARLPEIFDVFVLSSVYEGLSVALVEAMALARPVVVTDAGGLTEVVEHAENGLVVPVGDAAAMADAIVSLLHDPTLRTSLGQAAQRRAADFDIRRAVRRIEQVYEELLQ